MIISRFLRQKKSEDDLSDIVNESCKELHEKRISTADLNLLTTNSQGGTQGPPKLKLQLGPEKVDYLNFVQQGWDSEKGRQREVKEVIEARQIEIKPSVTSQEENEVWFSIDREDYEVKPVRITLVPKIIKMFCKKPDHVM